MDAIEIILVFVSSGGAKADKNLGEYAERALRMDKQFCSVVSCSSSLHSPLRVIFNPNQAQKYCRLKHVVSLWQTVSIQFSRQLVLKEQVNISTGLLFCKIHLFVSITILRSLLSSWIRDFQKR